ncbi:MAG: hypothetical protein K2G11_07000, partial [Muribaculaceae bacterium]|nr:hypothetical protein [Muribaculaceae bacterium]
MIYTFTTVDELKEEIFRSGLSRHILVRVPGKEGDIEFYPGGVERMLRIGEDTDATMVYSSYRTREKDGEEKAHPV